MNKLKLNTLIKEKKIVIPLYVLRMYKEFNLSIDELVLLIYLYDQDGATFDPNIVAKNLSIDLMEVMEIVSNLSDKGLINVITKKNEKGVMEEAFDLSLLYEKITSKIIGELNEKEENDLNIHNLIEDEFGRRLTPLENEMIEDWENNNYDKELIREAVKEASINGVSNLRYIDKILYEWNKKGYKKPQDIKKKEERNDKVEIFNCDWLNEDDDDEI